MRVKRITAIAFGALLVTAVAAFLISFTRNLSPLQFVNNLFLDDRGEAEAGAVFETAFALDASCDGLNLWRSTTSTDKEQIAVFKRPRWFISFSGPPPHDFDTLYAISMTLSPGDDVNFSLSDLTAKEAVNKACFVAKHKGY